VPNAPAPNDPNPLSDDPDAYLERLTYRTAKTDHGKLGYVMGLGLLFIGFMALFLCGLAGSFFLHSPFISR
jgi:hypothetical protein